jgi:hypothetical protein
MSRKNMITSVLIALTGLPFPITVRADNRDWANIESVVGGSHSLTDTITIGRPFTFRVHLQYSLASQDFAQLLSSWKKGGCAGSAHQTNGGTNTRNTQGSNWLDIGGHLEWNYSVLQGWWFLRIGVTVLDPITQTVSGGSRYFRTVAFQLFEQAF